MKRIWVGLFALAAISGLALIVATRIRHKPKVESDIESIHAMGIPITREEFTRLAPTEGSDAWPLYESYIDKLPALSPAQRTAYDSLAGFGFPGTPYAIQVQQAQTLRELVKPLAMASSMPRTTFPSHDASDVLAWEAVYLLPHMAVADAETGNTEECLRELRTTGGILRQLGLIPTCVSELQSDGLLNGYAKATFARQKDSKFLEQVIRDVQALAPPMNVRWHVAEGFLEVLEQYRSPRFYSGRPRSKAAELAEQIMRSPAAKRDAVAEIEIWRIAFAHLPASNQDWEGAQTALRQAYAKVHPEAPAPTWAKNKATILASADLLDHYGNDIAMRRMIITSARLLLERNKTGSFPTALASGAESTDPFSGEPFLYKPNKTGFVLYSIGSNRVDDGGTGNFFGAVRGDIVLSY